METYNPIHQMPSNVYSDTQYVLKKQSSIGLPVKVVK